MNATFVRLPASALVAAFLIAIALLAYDRLVVRPMALIGVVDVGEVYRLKEAEFTRLVTKASSENERQQALLIARQFAQRLPVALEELPHDCQCLVVVRTAVAGAPPHAVDLTSLLKHKVDQP
ncbi:MAG: hypothetical protein V4724_20740 [Pseudomonadota bacterium]